MADTSGDNGTETKTPLKEQTAVIASQTKDKVVTQIKTGLSTQKQQAADSLNTFSQALIAAGDHLRAQGQDGVGQYVDKAAQQVSRTAGYLNEHEVDLLVAEVEGFARRRPELFLAGAVGLGLLAARFLKSSAHGTTSSSDTSTYQLPEANTTTSAPGTHALVPTGLPVSEFIPETPVAFGHYDSIGIGEEVDADRDDLSIEDDVTGEYDRPGSGVFTARSTDGT